VVIPEKDETGAAWIQGAATAWADELRDPSQDIYTLQGGQPVNPHR
jgi:hypothetical protein